MITRVGFLSFVLCVIGGLGCDRTPYPAPGRYDFSPLISADQFVVFSLDPKPDPIPPPIPPAEPEKEGFFHGYPVLGSASVGDEGDRKALLDAIQDGMNRDTPGAFGCFWPRHGMRVVQKGEQTDFVICFECHYIRVYRGEERDFTSISHAAEKKFNEFLQSRGVPLAPE